MGARSRRAVLAVVCGVACTAVGAGGAAGATGQLEDPLQCVPFAAADSPQAQLDGTRGRLLPLLASLPAAQHLFEEYLTPGTATAAREEVTDAAARREFARAAATASAEHAVLARLRTALERRGAPRLRSPSHPVGGSLARRGLGKDLDIAYPLGFTTPGLIAGGTGSVDSAAGSFDDARTITGRYQLRPSATRRGVLRRVELRLVRAGLEVLDSIDFCPGGLGGSAGVALGTLTMSRLERTPHPSGTYATPVLWRLRTPLPPLAVDVTRLYRGNDRDRDGLPERQPWRGARFPLDPCPRHRGRCGALASGAFGPLTLPALLRATPSALGA